MLAPNQSEDNSSGIIIQKIHLINFLCHKNYVLDLSENHIQWIYGANGSGKSTLLSGLILGLGGKAATTGKGNNVSRLIAKNENCASIKITLNNRGARSYKQEYYGDSITIIRKINSNNNSEYSVAGGPGYSVARVSFEEVKNIVKALNIHVENPISVMSSKMATHLTQSDSTQLYATFKKATFLDVINENFRVSRLAYDAVKESVEGQEHHILKLEKDYKEKYEEIMLPDIIKTDIDNLRQELFLNDERDLPDIKSKHEKKKTEIKNKEKQLSEEENILSDLMSKKENIEQEIKSLDSEVTNDDDDILRKKNLFNKLKNQKTNKENAKQRDQLQCELELAEKAKQKAQASYNNILEKHTKACKIYNDAAEEIRNLKNKMKNIREELESLAAQATDEHRGPRSPRGPAEELQRRILEASFSQPPLGPVGDYLELVNISDAVEHLIRNYLGTFCVNNMQDARILLDIIDEVFPDEKDRPSVSCCAFSGAAQRSASECACAAQHSARECACAAQHSESECTCAAQHSSALRCAFHALVFREHCAAVDAYLRGACELDAVLLVPDQDTANRLADNKEIRQKCKRLVTLDDCSEYYLEQDFWLYGPSGGVRSARRRPVHRSEGERCEEEARRRELQAELLAAEGKELEAQRDRASEEKATEEVERLRTELSDKAERVSSVRTQLSNLPPLQEGGQEDSELEGNLIKLENELKSMEKTIQPKREKLNSLKSDLDKQLQEYKNHEQKKINLEKNIDTLKTESSKLKQEIDYIRTEMDDIRNYLGDRFQESRDGAKKEFRESTLVRKQLSEQLKKKKQLEPKWLQLEPEQLKRAYEAAKKKYDSCESNLKDLKELLEELRKAVQLYSEKAEKDEMMTIRFVKLYFTYIMAKQNYSGRIDVSRERMSGEKMLSWVFEGRLGEERKTGVRGGGGAGRVGGARGARGGRGAGRARGGRGARGAWGGEVSGGERSYAVVSLLLALWHYADLPMHFLDEIDRSLDESNKITALEKMMEFVQMKPKRQLVLFTQSEMPPELAKFNVKQQRLRDHREDLPMEIE